MSTIWHPEKNFLFLHIPKTGGSTISTMILASGGYAYTFGHDQLSDILDRMENPSPQSGKSPVYIRHVYTMIRDPLKRAVSMWNYFKGSNFVPEVSLTEFLDLLPITDHKDGRLLQPQVDYFKDCLDRIPVSFMLFDNFRPSVDKFKEVEELEMSFGHDNRRRYDPYSLSPANLTRIHELYAEDFELYHSLRKEEGCLLIDGGRVSAGQHSV